jgi:hypothetical protein
MTANVITWPMLSPLVWPKLITLRDFFCITMKAFPFSGRHPSPHVEQGGRQGSSFRTVVLQERARVFESSTKEDEKFAEKNQARKVGRFGGRSF